MSEYTPVYRKPYTEGFVNAPPYKTPVTLEILNAHNGLVDVVQNKINIEVLNL